MSKRLTEVYALAVCFVSMGCLSIFSGIFLYGLVELSFPETLNSPRRYMPPPIFPTSPPYGAMRAQGFPGQEISASSSNPKKTTKEKKKQFEDEQKQYQEQEAKAMRLESIKSSVRSIIIIFIAVTVFFFHWRIAKKVSGENNV